MGDGTKQAGTERADRDPPLREGSADLLRGAPGGLLHLEVDDIGLDRIEGDAESVDPGHALGEPAGERVVLGEAVDVVLERVDPGRGEDPGLAHRPAEPLLPAPYLAEPVPRGREHRAHRTAEALAEVDPHGIEPPGEVAGRDPGRDRRVEEPGAVHVGGEIVFTRHLHHRLQRFHRPYRSSAEVGGLLDREEPRAGGVAVGGVTHRRPRLRPGVDAPFAIERRDHHAAQGRRSSALEVDDVRGPVGDDLVPRGAVHPDGELVAHRPRREEHRGLLAEELRHHLAQAVDTRVFHALLVADRRPGHRFTHGRGGEGLGVAVEVDHGSASTLSGLSRSVRTLPPDPSIRRGAVLDSKRRHLACVSPIGPASPDPGARW